jgi:rhodanese-related sulfurtransferase
VVTTRLGAGGFSEKIRKEEKKMGKVRIGYWVTLAALLLAFASEAFAFGQNKFELEVETEKGAIKLAREVQRGGYDIISTEELKKMIDAGKDVLIVDTMPFEDSYKKEHVPGAKQFLFPIPDMETWDTKETDGKSQEDYAALLGPDKDKTIVIYCGFVKCTRSHNGAVWARKLGHTKVLRYPGGIFAWKGAGYPVESAQ